MTGLAEYSFYLRSFILGAGLMGLGLCNKYFGNGLFSGRGSYNHRKALACIFVNEHLCNTTGSLMNTLIILMQLISLAVIPLFHKSKLTFPYKKNFPDTEGSGKNATGYLPDNV